MIDKKEVCFIRARQRGGDYYFDAVQKMGYDIIVPYKDTNLVKRIIREFWFKFNLPFKHVWFNKAVSAKSAKVFIIKDPLMRTEFLTWMKKCHSDSRIILDYDNRVIRSINPSSVPSGIEKWTYDDDDAKKYNMNIKHGSYLDIYKTIPAKKKDIDVLYLGRDKGRLNELIELEKSFNDAGLKTVFRICADRSYMQYKNKIYQPLLPYTDYLKLQARSKAVLNVLPHGQTSITQREYEAVFNNVKCITTNHGVLDFELYDSSRYFVLGKDRLEDLPKFINIPFKPVDDEVLKDYTFDRMIELMIGNKIT